MRYPNCPQGQNLSYMKEMGNGWTAWDMHPNSQWNLSYERETTIKDNEWDVIMKWLFVEKSGGR